MSRVDDDRQDQRIEQARLLQKQQAEAKAKDAKAEDSAFAKKMATTQTEKGIAGKQAADAKQSSMSAYESLLDNMGEAEKAQSKDGGDGLGRSVLKQAASAFQEKLKQSRAGEGERMGESRLASADAQASMAEGRADDARGAEHTSEGRASDSKSTREEQNKKGLGGMGGEGAGREEKLKASGDGGGQKGSGGGSDGGNDPTAGGFRFNPALMAPVPVAKPKDTAGSERARKIATEIAQKIVERVRVGTNAAGNAEFQIDLRSNVMSGLGIKVSSRNGRISATFSGSDKDVLKLLEENKEALQKALSGRGLTLEELKIEVRA